MRRRWIVLGLVAVLALAFLGAAMSEGRIQRLEAEVDSVRGWSAELWGRVDSIASELRTLRLAERVYHGNEGMVDLSTTDIQGIGDGFFAARLSAERHLTGLRVRGRIVNATSVRHEAAQFRITIGEQRQGFTVNIISPGNSTSFNVYVPDVAEEQERWARIEYQQSMIRYYR